ncbi:polyprenyl synthetase family protein [Amycolatopsis thailandensis]|uniref:polyprenyl synthetase family protein n=1 Tax=Amycolatopsis thailandensis TaxID=589330 RepID=UPI003634B095
MTVFTANDAALPIDLAELRARVTRRLVAFLDEKERQADRQGLLPEIPIAIKDHVTAGGKRIRPLLCLVGWQAAGGRGTPDMVLQTAAALEMYQAFALIHDDIIDNSQTRRSQPTVHRALAQRYAHADDARHLGLSAALLVGNMALTWSDELFTTADVPDDRRTVVSTLLDSMRQEMHYGQYLDLLSTLGPLDDHRTPMTVVRYKTAKYTIERPLHIGAALAGAGTDFLEALSRFALPLGDAFQFRDDLLGLYGDPATTGKPVLDDLREGKHTLVLALATAAASPAQQAFLAEHVGDPCLTGETGRRILGIITATGAAATVERMITDRYNEAVAALDSAAIPSAAVTALRRMATDAVRRVS